MEENLSVWIDLTKRELETTNVSLKEEKKKRQHAEFLLVLFCIISIIYIYPATECNINSLIEIPSISLKIPLKIALIGFPTLIAATYLILLNAAIKHSRLKIISVGLSVKLKEAKNKEKVPEDIDKPKKSKGKLDLLLLPSSIQMPMYIENKFIIYSNLFVQLIIGLVFNLIPYLSIALISLKTQQLMSNIFILCWNILCVLVMLTTFVITYFNYSTKNIFEGFIKK